MKVGRRSGNRIRRLSLFRHAFFHKCVTEIHGQVPEWLGTRLQSGSRRFDSGLGLTRTDAGAFSTEDSGIRTFRTTWVTRSRLGILWASCFNQAMPTKSPAEEEVVAGLQQLLKRGLPVAPSGADPALLNLRGVIARAADPADDASRTAALDGTLRGLLARFDDTRYAQAARALFGLPPAEPGQNLTVRRDLAAASAGHEVHHFRKRVEPKLVEKIAWELLADADRFTRLPMIAPRLAPVTGRQRVQPDPFAWEVAEHEEQLTRLWSAIYAARCELLAVERLISLDADRMDIIHTAVTAAWRWATARAEAISYTTAFAHDLEASADELISLAGWTPALTPAQASRLTEAAAGGPTREQFTGNLHSETGLGDTWVNGYLTRSPSSGSNTEQQNGTPA